MNATDVFEIVDQLGGAKSTPLGIEWGPLRVQCGSGIAGHSNEWWIVFPSTEYGTWTPLGPFKTKAALRNALRKMVIDIVQHGLALAAALEEKLGEFPPNGASGGVVARYRKRARRDVKVRGDTMPISMGMHSKVTKVEARAVLPKGACQNCVHWARIAPLYLESAMRNGRQITDNTRCACLGCGAVWSFYEIAIRLTQVLRQRGVESA